MLRTVGEGSYQDLSTQRRAGFMLGPAGGKAVFAKGLPLENLYFINLLNLGKGQRQK